MAEQTFPSTSNNLVQQARTILIAVGSAAVLGIFSFWGGVPARNTTVFWVAVGIFIAVLIAFGVAVWHLLVRPLPAGQAIPVVKPIAVGIRRGLALLLCIGGLSLIVGGFWDEVWHRQYGVPFGDDFFWRPHLLMYFGFFSVIILAFVGLYLVVWQGKGTFQQRFRANPVVGLMILVGAFLMFVLPADPLWHSIIGTDLSAWGIPHLTVVTCFILISLLSIVTYQSTLPAREWRAPLQISGHDVLPILNIAACFLVGFQFFTTEWDNGGVSAIMNSRPEWLLPMLIGAVTVFFGVTAIRSLRLPGAATLAGLVALGVRTALISLFDVPDMMFANAWLLALLPLLLLDVYTAFAVRTGRTPTWWETGLAGALGTAVVLVALYPQIYRGYPIDNLPIAIIAVVAGCLIAGWLGTALGDYFANGNKQLETAVAPAARTSMYVSLAVFAACVAFVLVFVSTATPPV